VKNSSKMYSQGLLAILQRSLPLNLAWRKAPRKSESMEELGKEAYS
jgi:hypothetical protein